MTNEERRLALYCLKANSDLHGEVCEKCSQYPECDHFIQDNVMEELIEELEQQSCYNPDEWCHDCKEYNHDKHCCPRFNKVIRDTVEEIKQQPCEDVISREEAQTAIEMSASRYTLAKEHDCMGQVEWSDQLIKVSDAVDIIRHLSSVTPQEPKTGHWISCSERLPEICEKDCHGNITFSKTVLTTQIYGNGFVYVGNDQYTTNNGGWLSEVPFDNPDERCKVIAWMPLPEPYKPQESEDKE